MVNVLAIIALCVAVVALPATFILFLDWLATGRMPRWVGVVAGGLRRLRPRRGKRGRPCAPEELPVALLGLELRRLGGELQRIDASDVPSKALRVQACTAAYDHVLLECCRTLDLPSPGTTTPLTRDQRFDAETSLIGAGFSW